MAAQAAQNLFQSPERPEGEQGIEAEYCRHKAYAEHHAHGGKAAETQEQQQIEPRKGVNTPAYA